VVTGECYKGGDGEEAGEGGGVRKTGECYAFSRLDAGQIPAKF
jgi:hypothetical protein